MAGAWSSIKRPDRACVEEVSKRVCPGCSLSAAESCGRGREKRRADVVEVSQLQCCPSCDSMGEVDRGNHQHTPASIALAQQQGTAGCDHSIVVTLSLILLQAEVAAAL